MLKLKKKNSSRVFAPTRKRDAGQNPSATKIPLPIRAGDKKLHKYYDNMMNYLLGDKIISLQVPVSCVCLNHLITKLFNWNFDHIKLWIASARHNFKWVQVSENYSDLTKWSSIIFKYFRLNSRFIINMFKDDM